MLYEKDKNKTKKIQKFNVVLDLKLHINPKLTFMNKNFNSVFKVTIF